MLTILATANDVEQPLLFCGREPALVPVLPVLENQPVQELTPKPGITFLHKLLPGIILFEVGGV